MDYYRLSQEELDNRINATRAYIRRQSKRSEDSKDSEVDLCYLEREEEQRGFTKQIHKTYLMALDKMRREEEEALREISYDA